MSGLPVSRCRCLYCLVFGTGTTHFPHPQAQVEHRSHDATQLICTAPLESVLPRPAALIFCSLFVTWSVETSFRWRRAVVGWSPLKWGEWMVSKSWKVWSPENRNRQLTQRVEVTARGLVGDWPDLLKSWFRSFTYPMSHTALFVASVIFFFFCGL